MSVFVQDDHGGMLLQLRSSNVAVYPNCCDQAAGGHVDAGQTYDQAALNELSEEIGIKGVELTVLGTFRSNNKEGDRIIKQFERSYLAQVPHDIALRPEVEEVVVYSRRTEATNCRAARIIHTWPAPLP